MIQAKPRSSGAPFRLLQHIAAAAGLDVTRCTVCANPCARTSPHTPVCCPTCTTNLAPRTAGHCPHCGLPFADPALPCAPCAHCLINPPPWQSFRCVNSYTGPLREAILRFKFHGALELGAVLGNLLATRCRAVPFPHPIDAVIPIPLHPHRLLQRGYNQTQELARPVAATLNAPVAHHLLERSLSTPHQTGLSREERKRNLRGAFIVPEPDAVYGRHVLLVDDIMTTGVTIATATRTLLSAGAASCHVAVVARTPERP